MTTINALDSNLISDKENMRRNIRNALANRSTTKFSDFVSGYTGFEPIQDVLRTFVFNFRENGGKYIPCNRDNLMPRFIQLIKSQRYFNVLNTNPNFKRYLDHNHIHYVDAVDMSEPMDAALVYSDILIARTGGVGFAQHHTLYPSMKNLAKDLIIISSDRFIYSDMAQALLNRRKANVKMATSMVEFLRPSQPDEVNGTRPYTAQQPRFILLMLTESEKEPSADPDQNRLIVEADNAVTPS